MSFLQMGLPQPLADAVQALGYQAPTPIQAQAIPLLLQGRDVIGSAQTGTGKTAAFALPMLANLGRREGVHPRALVVVPTRELAVQVEESIRKFGRFANLRTGLLYGGVGYGRQFSLLRSGLDIVVATPGRLLDHIAQRTLNLSCIRYLVLDEADRMLDMGFLPDMKKIIGLLPAQRQTALFSATIPPQIETLIRWAMRNPQTIEIGLRRSPAETVKHALYPVAAAQKSELLRTLLQTASYRSAIVFCRTKRGADRVGQMLKANQHRVAVLHSNRSQRERDQALAGFRSGSFTVLVATDIAARGIDVASVSHVINYDVPHHPEDYVHRIGRTGRAESSGDAFTLVAAEDAKHVRAIERFIGQSIRKEKVENFAYQYTTALDDRGSGSRSPRAPQGGVRAVRLSGGYYFGRGRRR